MQIDDIIWSNRIINKVASKHGVAVSEVEEVFYNRPKFRKAENGKLNNEDLYFAYGRTDSGRYLVIMFIYKKNKDALIVTARDMDLKERKRYAEKQG